MDRRKFMSDASLSLAGITLLGGSGCKNHVQAAKKNNKTVTPSTKSTIPTKQCLPTGDNIEGPFYCPSAPWRAQIAGPKEPGTPLHISGVVYKQDCKTPLSGAIIEIWHANAKGEYDNSCQLDPKKSQHLFRARLKTNAKGGYHYQTILPGRYLNGPRYRPAHIHYKVFAKGHQGLTTQLYFQGDPYIVGDPFVRTSLVIPLQNKGKHKRGIFDIVLQTRT